MTRTQTIKRTCVVTVLLAAAMLVFAAGAATTAEATGGPSIFWVESQPSHIREVHLDQFPVTIGGLNPKVAPLVSKSGGNVRSIAVDTEKGFMYWTDYQYGRIGRATLTGGQIEKAFISGIGGPMGIALDTEHNMLYWTDFKKSRVQRVGLADPSLTPETLYSKANAQGQINRPYGIALDVSNNKVYWTDIGTKSIHRAPLNGGPASDIEELVKVKQPRGIALDPGNNRMYWVNFLPSKIQYADLNGEDVQDMNLPLVVTPSYEKNVISELKKQTRPEWVAIDPVEGRIYWTQTRTEVAIKRANLDASDVETVVSFDTPILPRGIALAYETTGNPKPVLPDLVVDVSGSSSAVAGHMIESLNITVSNVGGHGSPTLFQLVVNITASGIGWAGATAPNTVDVPLSGIPVGDVVTSTWNSLVPASGPWGNSLVFCVEVDPHPGMHDESDESNNTDCHTINIVDPLPDLEVQLSGPSAATPGDGLGSLIEVVAVNSGLGPAPSGYAVDLVLSTDQIVPPGNAVFSTNFKEDALLRGGRVSGVAVPGGTQATVTVFGSMKIPGDTPAGSYFLCARIDPFDDVEESNEPGASNVSCIPIQIGGGP